MGGQRDWRSYRRERHRIPRGLIALLLPSLLGATTCAQPRPCQLLASGGAAFIGDIVSAGPRQAEGIGFLQRYRVRIVESIYGIRQGQSAIDVYSYDEFGNDDGSWPFGRYLFVGVPQSTGLTLGTCGQPQPVAEAAAAIRYLRSAVRMGRTASLELRVYSIAGSAAGSVVSLEKGKRRLERLTAEPEQKVRFGRLNPGAYRISVRLPGHELERESAAFDVPPGACLTEDARLVPTNYIRGVVVDAGGGPASGVPVSLRFDRHPNSYWPTGVRSGPDGRFEMKGIPPGKYHLATSAGYVDGLESHAPAAFASNPIAVTMETRLEDVRLTTGGTLSARKLRIHRQKHTTAMGNLSSYDAATPDLMQTRGVRGRGSDFEYLIPKELTTRIWLFLEKDVVIAPGENDVEITAP